MTDAIHDDDSCAMAALVEARHDRRLGEAEDASLARHIDACASCRRLARELEALSELAGSAPLHAPGAMDHRRARLRLLQLAAAPPDERGGRARRWLVPSFAVAAVLMAGGAAAFAKSGGSPLVPAQAVIATHTNAVVRSPGAVVRGRAGRFELDAGILSIRSTEVVEVRVADAVLEGRGAFSIQAEDGRVSRVSVASGSVEVREGEGRHVVTAGSDWSVRAVVADPRVIAVASDAPAEARAQDGPPQAGPLIAPRARSPRVAPSFAVAVEAPAPVASAEPAPTAAALAPSATPTAPPSPSTLGFREAMKLIESGRYDDATDHLRAFRKSNPADPRAEDASFLEIIALERAGRHVEAQSAARRYLGAYPNGFRRAEAQRLANAP